MGENRWIGSSGVFVGVPLGWLLWCPLGGPLEEVNLILTMLHSSLSDNYSFEQRCICFYKENILFVHKFKLALLSKNFAFAFFLPPFLFFRELK